MSIALFKIDEDLPAEIAAMLRAAGHDATTVAEQRMVGTPDDRLWEVIVVEGRSLITADVGFADARRVAAAQHIGIVLLRLARESRGAYIRVVSDLLATFPMEQVAGCVVRVTEDSVRVHDTRAEPIG